MKLRSHLLVLAAAAALPIAVFSTLIASLIVDRERDTSQRSATERTRALMTAVDAELRGSIATLQALATSRSLEKDDLRAFHEDAVRGLASQPNWLSLNLARPSGERLLDTSRPFGAALPPIAETESFERALKTLRPAIGGAIVDAVTGRPGVSVRVPVLRQGATAYVLTAIVSTDSFGELLRAQRLPQGWAVAIADAGTRFVARIPHQPAGAPAAPGFAAALKGDAPEGWFRARTVEGRDTSQSYSRSAFSGWGVGIAVPQEAVDATAWRTAAAMGAGAALSLALAFALALFFGRRIAGPIASLASRAHAIGRGGAVEVEAPARVTEVAQVAAALEDAAAAVRHREETQRRAEEALRAANRSKDEFLATLSHELRNPLAAITMSAHVLRVSGERPELVRQSCDVLERQSAHMARLIEDLLDMSRVTFGKVSVEPVPMDLGAAAERLVGTWRSAGRLGGHEVRTEIAPAWIRGDPARIEQIIGNLLDNALKFTPAGGRITVRVAQQDGHALLEVSDTGIGFPEGLEGSVFGLFVQGTQTLDRPRGGLGIGLALVKRLAELHGASAEARSAGTGRGSTFSVRFPPIEAPRDEASMSPARAGGYMTRSILVVEDNHDARAMLRAALEANGHTVREAADGAAALAELDHARPDVAIIDIGLPGINGYELARRMRSKLGEDLVLIAVSGYGHAEDKQRAAEAGFDAHLTKPVDPVRLQQLFSDAARAA